VKRVLCLVALLAAVALAADKTTCENFTRGGGRAWRGAIPSSPSLTVTLEGKPGAIVFDASKDADGYLVYLFDKQPVVEKGQEEKFWTGDFDGFVGGVEIKPREGAKKFTIVDPNSQLGWSAAYVFAVENKSRKALSATWKEGVKDHGEDGGNLGEKYRAAKRGER
jgi:hypothetical protein